MSASADCPILAAFRAVRPVLNRVDPGGSATDVFEEYGFYSGSGVLAARAVVEAGLAGAWSVNPSDAMPALRSLEDFVEGWSDYLIDSEDEPVLAAARAALALALDPAVEAAADAGVRAWSDARQPGAGPFPGVAVLSAGFSGPAAAAFVAGFMACVPAGGLRVDPVSGALLAA